MDNETPNTAATSVAVVSDEDREYAVAVVKKQAGLPADQAEANVDAMPADQVVALVVAGRGGQVALCREILGLN